MIDPIIIGVLGTLIAVIIPGLGSGYAMQRIGELSESLLKGKESGFFTNSLIFSVLAETPTIYGLLVAIIILMSISKVNSIEALGMLLSGVSVAIPGIAAAYSIGLVSQAALVAINEKKTLFGKTLIFAALPEAIAIYGLIISILILMSSGAFGASKLSTMTDIEKISISTLIISIAGVVALFIGRIAVSAIKSLVSDESTFSRSLIISVLPESIALYALLVSVLIMSNGGYI